MKSKLKEEFVLRAKKYLSYPVRTIDQVAHKLGCDRRTLSKAFKEQTGVTPSEYRRSKTNGVTSFRIARAQRLLRQTDLSLKEIAVKVGYSENDRLCITFKKQVGETPSEYRKHFRKRPIPVVVFEAQRLLVKTDKPLRQISEQLGYEDVSALAKLFERHVGESCREFRHRHWGGKYFPDTVKKAKKLLIETDLTAEQISKRLGYQDSGSLKRMLSNVEGMTPRQFRVQERERLAKERAQRGVSLG